MAGAEPQRQMSLIPYTSDSQEIVLRRGNAIVVFDPESRQLSLHGNPQTAIGGLDHLDLQQCPYCHRPMQDDANPRQYDSEDEDASSHDQSTFVNPEYFRMLAHSIPNSAATSRPASPLKRLPGLKSAGSRNISISGPPTGAEFVGSAPSPSTSNQGIKDDSFLPNYFKHFFVEKSELGRGGRGVVLLVEHYLDKVFLGEFACKRIPVGNDHGWLEKVLIEVQLLQRLNHPNLVSYHHVWLEDAQITNFGPSVPCIFILQQYCNSGDLHNYVLGSAKAQSTTEVLKERMRRRSKGYAERPTNLGTRTMNFDEIFSFFRDITSGLHHLHTNGYIHRDLKPSNCLLHNDGQKMTVHVSDFGEVQAANEQRNSTGATGTISYCAPEVLQRQGANGEFGEFTTKSDIFSLGMIVYFMCFGRLPYQNADTENDENEDLDKLRAEVSAWHGFDDVTRARTDLPEKLYKFLKRLLSPDPSERPSTEQILQAIKAGGEIDDIPMNVTRAGGDKSPDLGSMGSRISSVDSPAPKKPLRTNSTHQRPGVSQLARHHSGELVHSKSPPLQPRRFSRDKSASVSTTTSTPSPPDTSTLTFRGRDIGTPPIAKQPTRLMLPPPPPPKLDLIHTHPSLLLTFKIMLFGLKFFLLSYPCAPFAGHAWLTYPLMGLALLDFTAWKANVKGTFVLMVVHGLVVLVAMRWGVLCNGGSGSWKPGGLYDGL
ncbi:kinase-like protein [Aureobasidium pullulans]|uniref:non-specific serine/threonine protein kinase n=1 Tax=Aureobasidium pullulans TaxID=5580 RepID=A0A4S9V9H2_AURPU|nr:kinase-like protein [Aureobasidium pullulans]THW93189.1 kinase-like protein [Aureobasidium pullulans]THZ48379.1 kinase-like protein [Aureobasidium pullulans]TIA76368.1 kinase-like protein [Aureobasidium pullulans]